ncbi:MAG: RDD family protein [Dehalococcoidia bacterium]
MQSEPDPLPAEFFERAGALAIEVALWISVSGGLMMIWGMVVAPFGGSVLMPFYPWSLAGEAIAICGALAWAYRYRSSPGMLALGLELVATGDRRRPGIVPCIIRALFTVFAGGVAFVFAAALAVTGLQEGPDYEPNWTSPYLLTPAVAFAGVLTLYLPMAFTKRRQSLVDLATRTMVLRKPSAQATIMSVRG